MLTLTLVHALHCSCEFYYLACPDLYIDEWDKFDYARNPLSTTPPVPLGHIAREHASTLTLERFRAEYEVPVLPVVIRGASDTWPANSRWTLEVRP